MYEYKTPEMEIVAFSGEDIVNTSVTTESTFKGMGGPNEGVPGDSFL